MFRIRRSFVAIHGEHFDAIQHLLGIYSCDLRRQIHIHVVIDRTRRPLGQVDLRHISSRGWPPLHCGVSSEPSRVTAPWYCTQVPEVTDAHSLLINIQCLVIVLSRRLSLFLMKFRPRIDSARVHQRDCSEIYFVAYIIAYPGLLDCQVGHTSSLLPSCR